MSTSEHPSRTAVITGASSGIGEALARQLSGDGWSVGLIARRADRLERLAAELRDRGGRVGVAAADVAVRGEVDAAIAQLRDELGPIELLVANAGLGRPDYLDPLTVDDIEQMTRVNLLGVVYAIAAVLPEMRARRRGQIGVVSSLGAFRGMPGSAGYCASKAAVTTFVEGLRVQLRGSGVSFTTIFPGFVRTPMTDTNKFHMPWLVEPEQAARGIASALRQRRKVYRFPWQMSLLVRVLRWLPDAVIARTLPRKSDTEQSVFHST